MSYQIISRAPGRICLFGDHQDYLELPVIACAINRYIEIKAQPNDTDFLSINKIDLAKRDQIAIDTPLDDVRHGDYLRLALGVLRRYGCIPNQGFDIDISGTIPINAGLSSSSALTIAWIQFLIEAFGIEAKKSPKLLARLAYETEVLEQGSSGGKMDQYTIGLGNLIFFNTKDDVVETLPAAVESLIIGVSGIAKDTYGLLAHLKSNAQNAIQQVAKNVPDFTVSGSQEMDIQKLIGHIDKPLIPIFEAAVKNHRITQEARIILRQKQIDPIAIGALINAHHELLRDNLNITVPRIDAMIESALRAGAYGAKIVGSGGGGCIVALAPKGNEAEVIEAIKLGGGVEAFEVEQSGGAKVWKVKM